ncbi:hypothetical protein CBS101457_003733 [Exobasidium rhododendri]|nr:hypothetical protein CBS101457_003733 [Exobasidium rhododendri]
MPQYTSKTPSRNNSFTRGTPTPTSLRGGRRLSLLSGSVLGPTSSSSPMTSPILSRNVTPNASSNLDDSTSVRKLQKGKRMSLSYVPSPVANRNTFVANNCAFVYDPTTPSAVGTPPAGTSANGGYFSRMNGSHPQTPTSAPPTSTAYNGGISSSASSSPTNVRSAKKEDGDTVMTQHRDLLTRIAEKERKILELKEGLSREEKELRELQREWQMSIHLEMAGQGTRQTVASENANSTDISAALTSLLSIDTSRTSEPIRTEVRPDLNQVPTNAAAEGWKAISAKISGAGNQLNALIDQLAIVPPDEEAQQRPEMMKKTSAGVSLDVLQEEGEEGDTLPPPLPISKGPSTSVAPTNRQAKRTSMFGSSMAALQKQVEIQFGGNEKEAEGDSGAWGGWQKRLKEARENATGLLAKAEAKLGQALTIDDLLPVESSQHSPQSGSGGGGGSSSIGGAMYRHFNASSGSGQLIDYSEENDREKAALAELSWMNSLAGINMSGTTDRVVTSKSSGVIVDGKKPLSSSNLGLLDSTASSSSRASRRASNTSHTTTSTSNSTLYPLSPVLGVSSSSPLNEDNKSDSSNQHFSTTSTAFGVEEANDEKRRSDQGKNSSHQQQASYGQSKSRMAAKMATMQERQTNKRSSADETRARSGTLLSESQNSNRSYILPTAQESELSVEDEESWGW